MANYDGPAVIVQGAARVVIDCSISVTLGRWEGRFWSAVPPLSLNFGAAKKIELVKIGYLPYAILENYEKLINAFRFWRNAKTPEDRESARHDLCLLAGREP